MAEKQLSDFQVKQAEKKKDFNLSRVKWFKEYMAGELPPFYRMRVSPDRSVLLTGEQQNTMAKLIQAGIVAKVLIHNVTGDYHIQKSISGDEDQILEFLAEEGITEKTLDNRQRKRASMIIADAEQARNLFAEKNLGLVSMLAARKKNSKSLNMSEFDDVVAEGKVGLMTAIDKFNPDRGTLFSTSGSFWVDQSILSYLDSKTKTIKMPTHMNNLYKNIQYAHKELREIYPSDDAITDDMISEWLQNHGKDITVDQIQQAKLLRRETISYEIPYGDGESSKTLGDAIESHENLSESVIDAIGGLDRFNALVSMISDNRKREILRDWYLSDGEQELVILSNVSRKHCLTKERVKQLKTEAEAELREKLIAARAAQNI